jgi:hypothetical protein
MSFSRVFFTNVLPVVRLVLRYELEGANLPLEKRKLLTTDDLGVLDDDAHATSCTLAMEEALRYYEDGPGKEGRSEPSILPVVFRACAGPGGIYTLALLQTLKILCGLGQPVFFYLILELFYNKPNASEGVGFAFAASLVRR